ncbi:MAG: hypothetical protein NVSMB29_01770 [Candidatus Dormibacteria bacterium]
MCEYKSRRLTHRTARFLCLRTLRGMADDPEVSPAAAHAAVLAGEAVLIDVREPWEYEEQHLPGARLIPLGELPDRIAEVPADRDVYVHCRMGGRSSRAVSYLRSQGRNRVHNVHGGLEAWEAAGLPTE